MIVTAALSWYNERPETLDRCVRAAANVADRIVALDGAYARFPGGKPSSPPEQAAAIREAAAAVGMDALILAPDHLWAGQVAKRHWLMNIASIGSDWLVVVDADHVIEGPGRENTKAAIGAYREVLAFEVPFYTPPGPTEAATKWAADMTGTTEYVPAIFRALPGFSVERFHWWYGAREPKEGKPVWLWGGDDSRPRKIAKRLPVPGYRVRHECLARTEAENRANRAFCNDRERVLEWTGQEDDRPDLPRPVYDFDRRLV